MMAGNSRKGAHVLGAFIDAISWEEARTRIAAWAAARESRYVCLCPVHSVVTATQDGTFQRVLNEADMATPDGAPVAWLLRRLGYPHQERIAGSELMWGVLGDAERKAIPIYFFGSREIVLDQLARRVIREYPRIKLAGGQSPPFRDMSAGEDLDAVARINDSKAGIVFVGLGCPKQERWMSEHRGRVKAVMIGVGAAFDFHAGIVKRAPLWMQKTGLEWLHRLCSEPRRLWKRYLVTNTLFVLGAVRQLCFHRRPRRFIE